MTALIKGVRRARRGDAILDPELAGLARALLAVLGDDEDEDDAWDELVANAPR